MSTPAVFFDWDGTFGRWQLCHDWIVAMVEANLFPRVVLDRADTALQAYRNRQLPFEKFISTLVEAYQGEERMKGVRLSDVEFVSKRLAEKRGDRVHVFTRELNLAAQELGYECAIITGSPVIAIAPFAERHGIKLHLGTAHGVDKQGRFIGDAPMEWSTRKGAAVRKLQKEHDLDLERSVAIGDSESDAQMLECVKYPIAFNPNMGLRNLAQSRARSKWPIVVERKLIYTFAWDRLALLQCSLDEFLPAELAENLTARLEGQELLA